MTTTTIGEKKTEVVAAYQCPWCEMAAFYFKNGAVPCGGDQISPRGVVLLDGEEPRPLDIISCGMCSDRIPFPNIDRIKSVCQNQMTRLCHGVADEPGGICYVCSVTISPKNR